MRASIVIALLVAVVASGCGGGEATSGGAEFAPAGTPAFITLNTEVDGEQWRNAEALLSKFPGRGMLTQSFFDELREDDLSWERDVRPALGEAVHIAWLDFANEGENVVFFTEPNDREKFEKLVECCDEPMVHREIDGWTVFAETEQLIDRFDRARGERSLADVEAYEEATGDLEGETLATAYVSGRDALQALRRAAGPEGTEFFEQAFRTGAGRLRSVVAAWSAEDEGVRIEATARATPAKDDQIPEPFAAELVSEVPAGTLLYFAFTGAGYRDQLEQLTRRQRRAIEQFERMVGVTLEDVVGIFRGEGALYVRPGSPIPEVTLLLRNANEGDAVATLDRLATRLAREGGGAAPRSAEIEGVTVKTLPLGDFGVSYAGFDGKLIVTTSPQGAITGLRGDGDRLTDDASFEEATEAAGMPDETSGFLYVNVEDSIPLVSDLARFSGQDVPSEVVENTRPLRSLVYYATAEEGEASVVGFLRIE